MAGQGTVIDELVVTLGLDPTQFNSERKNAARDLLNFKQESKSTATAVEKDGAKMTEAFSALQKRLLGVAALFLGGMGLQQFAEHVTKITANTGRLANQLGETTSDLDTWIEMGKRVGASGDEISGSIGALNSQIEHFRITGQGGQFTQILSRMGISLLDVNGKFKTTTQMLREMAAWAQGKDARTVTQWFKELGMSPGMINLLLQGPAAIDKMSKSIHEIGTATDADAKAAARLQAEWAKLEQKATSLARSLMTVLTPALVGVMQLIEQYLKSGVTVDDKGHIVSSSQVDALGNVVGNEVDAYGKPLHKGGPVGPDIAPKSGGPATSASPETYTIPGKYRPVYRLGAADLSDGVVNTIAGEARNNQQSIDAVINNMLNRVGTKTYGPSANLLQVARAPGQYAGYRRASPQEAALIRSRLRAIASGSVPDNTSGSNEYRASYYHGPWYLHHLGAPVVGGNRFALNPKGGKGIYSPYAQPHDVASGSGSFSDALRTLPRPDNSTSAILNAVNRGDTNNVTHTSQVSVGDLHIHTAAKDADGIARDLKPALQRSLVMSQATYGQN